MCVNMLIIIDRMFISKKMYGELFKKNSLNKIVGLYVYATTMRVNTVNINFLKCWFLYRILSIVF